MSVRWSIPSSSTDEDEAADDDDELSISAPRVVMQFDDPSEYIIYVFNAREFEQVLGVLQDKKRKSINDFIFQLRAE